MPFYIEKNNLPSWHKEPANYTLARLGMSSPSCSTAPRVATGNFFGHKNSYDVFVRADRPWMKAIPGYVDQNGYSFAFRNCCDFIDPRTVGSSYYYSSSTKSFVNNGTGKLTHGTGTSVLRENTQHLFLSMTGGGGGGSGSSGTKSGCGGGAGATVFMVVDLTKIKKVEFIIGKGGNGGTKGTSASTNRHGSSGGETQMKLTLNNNNVIIVGVAGGGAGQQFASNNSTELNGHNVAGVGGSQVYIRDGSNNIISTHTSSGFGGAEYIAINSSGVKATYPDTTGAGLVYLINIISGGNGGPGGSGDSTNITKPLSVPTITYCTGVTHTPAAQTATTHTAGLGFTSMYGGDGGYSLYGQGGIGSFEYKFSFNDTTGLYNSAWTNAGNTTGYGAGGAGDVFLVGFGKNGTAGGDGVVYILSYNSAVLNYTEIDDGKGTPVNIGEILSVANGAIVVEADEYIDTDWPNDLKEDYHSDDSFVFASYLENNQGIVVPVIYKTDLRLVEEYPEYADPDLDYTFYYVGQEYNSALGKTCDKWRRISHTMPEELNWGSTGKIYIYTNIVVVNNRFINTIFAKELSGTEEVTWNVFSQTTVDGGLPSYNFSSGIATINAPDGCTFVEVSEVTLEDAGAISGKVPSMTPNITISSDKKTATIRLTSLTPFAVANGIAKIKYTLIYQ